MCRREAGGVGRLVLIILVRESENVQPRSLARLQRERLGKLLERFQLHPSCVGKTATIEQHNGLVFSTAPALGSGDPLETGCRARSGQMMV